MRETYTLPFDDVAFEMRRLTLDDPVTLGDKLSNRASIDLTDLLYGQQHQKQPSRYDSRMYNKSFLPPELLTKDLQGSTGSSTSSDGSLSEYSGSLSPDHFDYGFDYQNCPSWMRERQARARKPPEGYLCHLCFCKGHYIKDCPEVSFR